MNGTVHMNSTAQTDDFSQMLGTHFDRWPRRALIVAGAGILLCLLGLFLDQAQFFRSYLFAYLFWLSMALGSFTIIMIHHLTSGDWGVLLRRPLEAGALTLPLLALLFIPLVFGLPYIYEWARPAAVAADELLQHKQSYLNVPFFLLRALFYFICWIGIAWLLSRWSLEQDRTGNPALLPRLQKLSAGGLVLFGLTVTFAFIDWIMSLSPHWYSTIYSVMVATGAILQAFAFVIIVVYLLAERGLLGTLVTPKLFNDFGSLLFAFVMLWAYMAFSQFLLIYSGNLTEEIPWYIRRLEGGWKWVALAIVLFSFALPFALLTSRELKRNARLVAGVSVVMVGIRMVDIFWLVAPEFHAGGLSIHWLDLATLVSIGGLWVAAYIWLLKRHPLLPMRDPRLVQLLRDEAADVAENAQRVTQPAH